ncbi:hypothetical protein BQ8482_10010 [Mesorhizobium delmotii]|uniref:Transposase n=1 Tax=Mesorhizobium delmotii TaxID=1631247 RepID=A0A2P9A9J8_9HYPH|nr:hypothetical protein BQ8482_10010 [Mesorhizobium delmotii]
MTKQQIDVITSIERRRPWSREKKERLIAARLEADSVSGVARSNCRLSPNRASTIFG